MTPTTKFTYKIPLFTSISYLLISRFTLYVYTKYIQIQSRENGKENVFETNIFIDIFLFNAYNTIYRRLLNTKTLPTQICILERHFFILLFFLLLLLLLHFGFLFFFFFTFFVFFFYNFSSSVSFTFRL